MASYYLEKFTDDIMGTDAAKKIGYIEMYIVLNQSCVSHVVSLKFHGSMMLYLPRVKTIESVKNNTKLPAITNNDTTWTRSDSFSLSLIN